jgi:hypothetical protein
MHPLHALASILLTVTAMTDTARLAPPWDEPVAARWKLNTHVFAANLALADAINDGQVTIPPYGAIAVNADALRALRKFPNDFRGGVVGPDVFPDIYVGQSLAHADKSAEHDRWTSDDWLQHLFRQARAWRSRPWSNPAADPDRVLAFAYGFLVHAAGDVFGHSYVNDWGDGQPGGGAYAWDWANPMIVARHVVVESYISKFTPRTNDTIDIWPRFAAELLIKHPAILDHTEQGAPHYKHWMRMHRWLGTSIAQATEEMSGDASYPVRCGAHPVACARKEFFESWQADIDHGLHNLVEANLVLGRAILAHRVPDGIKAFFDWNSEWALKMHGAHAPAEVMKWISEHDPLAPVKDSLAALALAFLKNQYPREFAYLQMMSRPAYYMDSVYKPNGPRVRGAINADMHLGPDSLLKWTEFAPLYNTVILTKLALLDGRGLNELARRAGIATPLYPESDRANVMLSVLKSMDGHRQWEGAPFGMPYRPYTGPVAVGGKRGAPRVMTAGSVVNVASGFPFWGDPVAREKIFSRIFKGYGPGPGKSVIAGTPDELPSGKNTTGIRRPPVVTTPRPVAVPRRKP